MIDPIGYKALEQSWESSTREASEAALSFNATQIKVLDERVAFYEKLALFATGTIAATITMAGSLSQKITLHWKTLLYGGWIVLLISMALCLIRNSSAHAQLYYSSAARFHKKRASQIDAKIGFLSVHQGPLLDEDGSYQDREAYLADSAIASNEIKKTAGELEAKSEKNSKIMKWFSWIAAATTCLGVAILLIFAIRNI